MTFTPASAETTVSTSCLRKARLGDSSAWAEIWQTYSDRVFRQILRCQLPAATAEELTVDVFHKVWRNLSRFSRERAGESLGAWINRVTSTSVRDYFRQQKRTAVAVSTSTLQARAEISGSLPPEEPSACQLALWRALGIVENETSAAHWECFRLARFAGLPHSEIGRMLKMSPTNVSTVASRVYGSIRREAQNQRRLIDPEIESTNP